MELSKVEGALRQDDLVEDAAAFMRDRSCLVALIQLRRSVVTSIDTSNWTPRATGSQPS